MREPAVTYYTYNEAPDRAWKSSKVWPLPGAKRTAFYLSDGSLTTKKPRSSEGATASSAEEMTFVTEPLARDTEVTGHASARLWLSSSSTDADIVARIDDVAPDGSHSYVGIEGKLRASLRATAKPPYDTMGLPWHPFTQASAQALTPGVPVEAQFEFLPTSYLFKTGHRIRLTLQVAAPEVRVLHTRDAPSMIELPIM
jgi:putative CocE/NonD family hydrolase